MCYCIGLFNTTTLECLVIALSLFARNWRELGPNSPTCPQYCTFFIQLNNVNKLKNKVLPPYVNSQATRWHIAGTPTASFSISVLATAGAIVTVKKTYRSV